MLSELCKYSALVVGLGNPESKYDNTRHNIGFRAVDAIAKTASCPEFKKKFNALLTDLRIGNKTVMLLKPMTYMNLSGEAVLNAMRYFNISLENVIVLYDDVSFDVGQMRIRKNGSSGGHNGIKSIEQHIGSSDFLRVKIGVGKKPEHYDLANWVLSGFSKQDNEILEKSLADVNDAVRLILDGEIEKAMNLYNKKASK